MKRTMTSPPNLPPKKSKFNQPLKINDPNSNPNPIPNSDSDSDSPESQFTKLDENLLYEVFKHADAKTLATASCVSKQWRLTAQDERLWELICTHHWSNSVNCGTQQLRSVVLALGGFRRLHARYLSKTAVTSPTSPPTPSVFPTLSATAASSSSSSSSSSIQRQVVKRNGSKRWGKDEVNLSLSLLSISFYEKMNSAYKKQ